RGRDRRPGGRRARAAAIAAPAERPRRPPSGTGGGALRRTRGRRRRADGRRTRARRRWPGRRERLGGGPRAAGPRARSPRVRAERPRQRPLDPHRGGRSSRGGHRVRPAPRRRRAAGGRAPSPAHAEDTPRPGRGAHVIEELTRACVHCGFCLPTCPTYVLWSEEMDSPRGRIQLMEKTAQGTLRLSPTVVEHFDRCLGCMACVSSCPSGVRYDLLIEETRATVEDEHPRPRGERLQRRLLFATLPHPRRLSGALRLAPVGRRLPTPRWARSMLELAPAWRSGERPPAVTPAAGTTVATVGLL